MNRLLLFFAAFVLVTASAFRTTLPTEPPATKANLDHKQIKWLTIQEAYALTKKQPRKFVVDVYTDWCGWCKVMDRKTFSQPAIIDYVNENFYPVRFNAEQTADVTLGKETFKFIRGGSHGVHELAAAMLKNQMSYPSTVFLDEKFNLIQPIPGYLEPRTFHQIITYFGNDYHQKEPFDQYKAGTYARQFQSSLTASK
ncbi:thioredoxin family protein [Spirosoma koreense]